MSEDISSYEKSKIAILPVGYDGTVSYLSGTREAPLAIIKASRFMEFYDPELEEDFTKLGIVTLPPLLPEMDGPQKMIANVRQAAENLLTQKKFVVMLGGEHSLTVGMVSAYHKYFPEMGVLQIDAHLDLRDSYEGSSLSHACAMRRIVDMCPIIQLGIRSVCEEEHQFVVQRGLKPYYSWKLRDNPLWQDEIVRALPKDVYITIDMDGLDPSIMPSVGTPEPDGLLWHDVMGLIQKIARSHRIVGFDVVELCPIPGFIAPDYLASKMVYKIIGMAHKKW